MNSPLVAESMLLIPAPLLPTLFLSSPFFSCPASPPPRSSPAEGGALPPPPPHSSPAEGGAPGAGPPAGPGGEDPRGKATFHTRISWLKYEFPKFPKLFNLFFFYKNCF